MAIKPLPYLFIFLDKYLIIGVYVVMFFSFHCLFFTILNCMSTFCILFDMVVGKRLKTLVFRLLDARDASRRVEYPKQPTRERPAFSSVLVTSNRCSMTSKQIRIWFGKKPDIYLYITSFLSRFFLWLGLRTKWSSWEIEKPGIFLSFSHLKSLLDDIQTN